MRSLVSRIYGVFESWRRSQINGDGLVTIEVNDMGSILKGRGLLGGGATIKRVPAEGLEAWQCAGRDVLNDIDLTFKLWLDRFAPLEELLLAEGIGRVFAAVGLWSASDTLPQSLIRLNGFLTNLLAGEALYYERLANEYIAKARKQMRGLPEGRLLAAKNKTKRAKELRERAHQMAIDYRVAHPAASEPAVIAHLRAFSDFKTWKKDSSLQRAIRGSQKAALRKLDTTRRE
jgi:hypothetical protein